MQGEPQNYQTAIDCLDRIVSRLKPESSTRMKSAIVALYSADCYTNLRYSQQIVLLHLDYDRHLKTPFFRLYHLTTLMMIMEMELYYGFMSRYKKYEGPGKAANLYTFDFFEEGIFGFQFRTAEEADIFNIKLRSMAPTIEQFRELQKKEMQEAIKKKKENSFFNVLKKKIFSSDKDKPKHEETVILQVTKAKTIHFDQNGGIITENLPPEWEEIFKVCGVKKSDLKKQEIAQLIMEQTILHETKKAALKDPTIMDKVGIKSFEELDYVEEEDQQEEEEKVESFQQKKSSDIKTQTTEKQKEQKEVDFLPLPPPPPPLDFLPPPPPLDFLPPPPPFRQSNFANNRISKNPINIRITMRRQNLLDQIRNNNIKLKPVKAQQKGIELDVTEMNKEERKDLGEQIRLKLQKRRLMTKKKKNSSDEDEDD